MNPKSVDGALRIVGVLILLMVAFEYLVLEIFLPPPVVIAVVLVTLSFGFGHFPKPITILSLLLCVAVPLSAAFGVMSGQIPAFVLVFDLIVFGWLGWVSVSYLKNLAKREKS